MALCSFIVFYFFIPAIFVPLGIGWAMVCMSLLVCIYYNMVVAWTLIYLFKIVTGSSSQWASCRNDYNTACRFASTTAMRD